jgi:hypothetical protein
MVRIARIGLKYLDLLVIRMLIPLSFFHFETARWSVSIGNCIEFGQE